MGAYFLKICPLRISLLLALVCAVPALANPCASDPNSRACLAFQDSLNAQGKVKTNLGSTPAAAPVDRGLTSHTLAGTVDRTAADRTTAASTTARNEIKGAEQRYLDLARDGAQPGWYRQYRLCLP